MSIQSLKRRWLGLAVFIGMFTLLLSCSQSNIQETGSATLGIATQALSAGDVQRVTITISGANISPSIVQNLVKAGNQWKGIIGKIPTGSGRTFLAQAYDNSTGGNLIYEGTAANVTITKGQPVTVVILLQQKNAPTPFDNKVPVINSVVASSNAVGPGETVNLTVNATDPDTGDTLSYTWSAGAGSFSSTSTTSTVWTAPSSSGSNTINIQVKDQKDGKVTASLNIDIQSFHSRGKAKLQVSFNTWPEVAGVTASKGRINVNETTDLAVTASDNDNDTLIYAWASDCGGSFSSTSASNPTFTSPGTAPTSGNCKLTVTVTDGNGGTNTGDITIQIGAPVAANSAPILETTFQSEENILAGGAVTLRVVARDPESGNMTISWAEQGGPNGTLGTPTTTGTTSEVVWTAGSGKCGGVVRVTVTDDGNPNATTTHDFTIACSCASGETECSATCVDTQTDTNNCGSCGSACSSGQVCTSGACQSTGPAVVFAVGTNSSHSCAITSSGMKCWGIAGQGNLGNGTNSPNVLSPPSTTLNLGTGRTVTAIAMGQHHTCALLDNSTVKCWGNNSFGQLGDGNTGSSFSTNAPPSAAINFGTGRTVKQITAGTAHNCAILDDDTVRCWGANHKGQIGNGTGTHTPLPALVNLGTGRTAKYIDGGGEFSCAILDNDTVKCWGQNNGGQHGVGNTTTTNAPNSAINFGTGRTPKQLVAGQGTACAILDDDSIRCWGGGGWGTLGNGSTANSSTPVTPNLGTGRTAKQISLGGDAVCAILDNDNVKCWGIGLFGSLGNGTTTNSSTPGSVTLGTGRTAKSIAMMGNHICTILDDDSVKCWGYNSHGQVGTGTTTNQLTPATISGL